MNKHVVGIRELAELLEDSPPKGRAHPDQPYSMSLQFDSVDSWHSAVDQYGATVKNENWDRDGHYSAVTRFAVPDDSPFAFAGAELHLVHVAGAAE